MTFGDYVMRLHTQEYKHFFDVEGKRAENGDTGFRNILKNGWIQRMCSNTVYCEWNYGKQYTLLYKYNLQNAIQQNQNRHCPHVILGSYGKMKARNVLLRTLSIKNNGGSRKATLNIVSTLAIHDIFEDPDTARSTTKLGRTSWAFP